MVRKAKQWFLAKLAGMGIVETELVVARMRKSRDGVVGYYSHMSQFRSRPRIVVDEAFILARYTSPLVAEEEMRKTIAYEYGHIMAEAIRVVNRALPGQQFFVLEHFTVPDWKAEFGNDEEAFAEDFARFCVNVEAHHEPFWDRFMPIYAADCRRIFIMETNHAR